jgi:anti-sigma factor RsiW
VSCLHVREELGAYVLGALEPPEREAVALHLARCPECAAEHDRLAGLPALLTHAEGLEIPAAPRGIDERVLDQIARERGAGRRARRSWIPRWARTRTLLVGTLVGAALGAGVTALVLADDPGQPSARYDVSLRGAGGASARAQLSPGSEGTEVHLWVEGLPPGGDDVYEVLCERPGWSASAGTFRVDARGKAYAVLTTAARVGEYESIRVVRRSDAAAVLSGKLQ